MYTNTFPTTCGAKIWSGFSEKITVDQIKAKVLDHRKVGDSVIFAVLNLTQMAAFGANFFKAGFLEAVSYHNMLHNERDPNNHANDTVILVCPTLPKEERAAHAEKIRPLREVFMTDNEKKLALQASKEAVERQNTRESEWRMRIAAKHGYIPASSNQERPCFCDLCVAFREKGVEREKLQAAA